MNKVSDTEKAIEEIDAILEISYEKTPEWINGVIISSSDVIFLERALEHLKERALKADEYFEQIMDSTKKSQEATVTLIREIIKKGDESIGGEEE